jgi:hypothetical protein
MATETDPYEGLEPRDLRAKLEASVKREHRLTEKLRASEAVRVITEKKLTRVKPEDFKDVDPDLIASRAEELETQRAGSEAEVLRNALLRSGADEATVNAQVEALLGGQAPAEVTRTQESSADAWAAARAAVGLGGGPVAPDFAKMSTAEKMEYGLTHPAKQ